MSEPINNTASMRTWLRQCPSIEQTRLFGVDYLTDEIGYSIRQVPTVRRTRENILGDTVLQERQEQNFVFESREPYGSDYEQNAENLGVMHAVGAWIVEQNNARNFPEWEGGDITAVMPTNSPYSMEIGSAFARYQLQFKVAYRVT